MTSDRIADLICAAKALSSQVDKVILQFNDRDTRISIRTNTDEDAALVASMVGAVEYDLATANGNQWVEYQSAGYQSADVRIQVTGPHRPAAAVEAM
jgi:hypothetical protein